MDYKKLLEKPFRLISIFGCVYILVTVILNLTTGFSYNGSLWPFGKPVSIVVQAVALVLCISSFFFYNKHLLYYVGMELLIISDVYNGRIFTALFLSSLLVVLFVTDNKVISKRKVLVYVMIELVKLSLVVPYGVTTFFNYAGLSLFYLSTIGCMNLLFRHAYTKKDSSTMDISNYKLSDRQLDCIKEVVLNNTTIKALAITHNVSESAIKKDLAYIYKVFGITGKADLKALFIGYNFN